MPDPSLMRKQLLFPAPGASYRGRGNTYDGKEKTKHKFKRKTISDFDLSYESFTKILEHHCKRKFYDQSKIYLCPL